MARLERWIATTITDRGDPDERGLLHRYAVWHMLRRLRRRSDGGDTTHNQLSRSANTSAPPQSCSTGSPSAASPWPPARKAIWRHGWPTPKHPPPGGRALRPLGEEPEADRRRPARHEVGRPDPSHRLRGPLGTGPPAAPRRHHRPRRPRRRPADPTPSGQPRSAA
jgi:hypothetical protein